MGKVAKLWLASLAIGTVLVLAVLYKPRTPAPDPGCPAPSTSVDWVDIRNSERRDENR
jgi:hypothetical protein